MHDSITDAQARRAKWVEEALETHEASLLRYAASLTGDVEVARDLVQDTFLRLCEQPMEAIQGHLVPWLFTVCRHRAVDWQRKERRMTSLDHTEWESRPVAEPSPAERAVTRDAAFHLVSLVEGLPANQREVVRLRFHGQLSYQEIAEITELSVTNVGFLLHTALKALRQRMAVLEPGFSPAVPITRASSPI